MFLGMITHLPLDKIGHNFVDDIFRSIFMNEQFYISIRIALKFVHKGPIDNTPALAQLMAWRRIGDKALSEPLLSFMLTRFTDAYMRK